MTQPAPGAPAWHPDPSGRHELRWWDGATFTDQVADGGIVSTDAGPPQPAPTPLPPPPAPVAPPAATTWAPGVEPVAATGSGSRTPLVLAGAAVVVLAGAGLYLFLRDRGGTSGTGRFEGTIDADAAVGVHDVSLAAGSVLTVEVEPSRDLDAVVGFVLAEEDADRVADLYDDLAVTGIDELDDAFPAVDGGDLDSLGADRRVLFRTDVGFAGDDEQLVLAVPFDVDVQVVVAPFNQDDDAAGDYEVTIEAFDLDVEDDAQGEELLEAVADDEEVPAGFRDLAEELLQLD